MKHLLVAVAACLVLAVAGCSKYEVFERNLVYMTDTEFQSQKAFAEERFAKAERELAMAQTSGDPVRLKAARNEYNDAKGALRSIQWEERRRNRTW